MQNREREKAPIDEVVLTMDDQRNPTPKQSPNNSADPSGEPKTPNPTTSKTKSLRRLSFSKPKSRFVELNYPPPSKTTAAAIPESHEGPLKPTACESQSSDEEEEEDEKEQLKVDEEEEKLREKYRKKKRKIGWRVLLEWASFFVIMSCLILSLTVDSLKFEKTWGLEIWKWCLMVLVIFCGRLLSGWLVCLFVFLIERNFMLREKVLYFVYGLRKSVQNCFWLALVLLCWALIFDQGVEISHRNHKILDKVSRALVAILIGAIIWLVKIILVKILASSFHVATFFDRMKESVFHHYILETLSGPPLDQISSKLPNQRSLRKMKSLPAKWKDGSQWKKEAGVSSGGSSRLDMERLRQLSRKSASSWSVKRLMSHVMSSGLSTISTTVDETMDDFGQKGYEITSEWEARVAAQRTFKHVAKPGEKYIDEEDLLRFLQKDEVHTIFPLFEGAVETGKIKKSAFRNWVVKAYFERKALAHSLNDTKTAVQQLHKLASGVVVVIIIVISLLVMGVATTKVILVVSSQLLLVGFVFQNTCKTIFESIIFVFVMHPFDTGDRCVIDGVQLIVDEMNILTTVFLRYDNEKIYYPNSVLLTKPISNFYRSPDMVDIVEFSIDVATPIENITALKKSIQAYLESKPKHWSPKHAMLVKEIENVNKMKMALSVTHTMNHQNYLERNTRRSDLLLELKRIFESLGIKYHLLPQEVHLSQVNLASGQIPPYC